MTLTNAKGSVTLQLTGTKPQPGFSPPAKNYTFTVNGSIAAQQDVPTGLYQDTVVANVEY